MNQAQIDDMIQIVNNVYYKSSSDKDDDDDTFHDSIKGDTEIDITTDDAHGKLFNNNV